MSATDTFELQILNLIFTNTAAANIGSAAGLQPSSPAGNAFIALHTADPTDAPAANAQTVNETAYTNYARQSVTRASGAGGWTVATGAASNTSAITFPTCGVTGSTVTHFSVGFATSGAGAMWMSGALTSSLIISNGVAPSFGASQLSVSLD